MLRGVLSGLVKRYKLIFYPWAVVTNDVPHAAITRNCGMRSHDPPLRSRQRRQCIKLRMSNSFSVAVSLVVK